MARPREFDVEEAVARAMFLFWRRGFGATSISDLQDELGIGRASLYAAFGSKDALFLKAVERYRERFTVPSVSLLESSGSAIDAIAVFFRNLLERYTDPRLPGGCLITTNLLECTTAGGEVGSVLAGSVRKGEEALYGALRRAREQGELPRNVSLRRLARFLSAAGQSMALMARVHDRDWKVVADVAETALSVLSAGRRVQ